MLAVRFESNGIRNNSVYGVYHDIFAVKFVLFPRAVISYFCGNGGFGNLLIFQSISKYLANLYAFRLEGNGVHRRVYGVYHDIFAVKFILFPFADKSVFCGNGGFGNLLAFHGISNYFAHLPAVGFESNGIFYRLPLCVQSHIGRYSLFRVKLRIGGAFGVCVPTVESVMRFGGVCR